MCIEIWRDKVDAEDPTVLCIYQTLLYHKNNRIWFISLLVCSVLVLRILLTCTVYTHIRSFNKQKSISMVSFISFQPTSTFDPKVGCLTLSTLSGVVQGSNGLIAKNWAVRLLTNEERDITNMHSCKKKERKKK